MNDIALALKQSCVVGAHCRGWAGAEYARARRRKVLSTDEAKIKRTVEELAASPMGLVEVKLDIIYSAVRIILILSVYLMAIQLCFAIPNLHVQLLVAPLSLAAFFSITGPWRKWKRGSRNSQ